MKQELGIEKKSVGMLFATAAKKPFSIPDYQRPYAWSVDEAEKLFTDIEEFLNANKPIAKSKKHYFLGCTVIVDDESKDVQEIVDGQQRITSIFLLLRAIYTKLESFEHKSKETANFIERIKKLIWKADPYTGDIDKSQPLITSNVISEKDREVFGQILLTGEVSSKAKDNYSKNYRRYRELFDTLYNNDDKTYSYQFILALLECAILLPITAESEGTALTVFTTLNDRGTPLSDADIFKATLYRKLKPSERSDFVSTWKDLEDRARKVDETVQQIFYYCMFYMRAKSGDKDTTTPGLRNYFLEKKGAKNKTARLDDPKLLEYLDRIIHFLEVVSGRERFKSERWTKNFEILSMLDILLSYPNEFWKYPVITYYLEHSKEKGFETSFLSFLRMFTAQLLLKYMEVPTVSGVKAAVLKLNAAIVSSKKPKFEFNTGRFESVVPGNAIGKERSKIIRMLLKILAYRKQKDLLPVKWEIEHIFPSKWDKGFFHDMSSTEIDEKIEYLGNKMPLEKALNIRASNGYFEAKKKEYVNSQIKMAKELARTTKTTWRTSDIDDRDALMRDELKRTISQWIKAYSQVHK